MSYETGTAVDVDDLIDSKLKNFAVANGWNLNDDSWPDHIHLSKGGCFISLRRYQPVPFNDAFSVSRTDHRLWGHLGSAYDGSGGTANARYIGQPDSLVDSTSTTEPFVETNDLTGPFTSYHLFCGTDGADRDYIYLVIESNAGFFGHYYFGVADDLGFAYDPPITFLTATYWKWWPDSMTESSSSHDKWFSTDHDVPFDSQSAAAMYFYCRGVEPSLVMQQSHILPLFTRSSVITKNYILDPMTVLGPNTLNGVTPLYPFHVCVRNSADTSIRHYGGILPNIRLCSIKGRSPKEELALGGDTWIIFPWRKQQDVPDIDAPASPAIDNTSWQAGVAIKKIV